MRTERQTCEDCNGTGHDMSHPECQRYGCSTCDGHGVLDSEADEHDAFLKTLVEDEYNFKVRMADVIRDFEVGVAYLDEQRNAADAKFQAAVKLAQDAKPLRLAKLRQNDLREIEAPRLIQVGDHTPELVR